MEIADMKAVFVFSGQGAQSVGMGKDIYEASPSAAAVFDEAEKILGWPLKEICFNGPEEKLLESATCQPAIYTASCACLAALKEKKPSLAPLACAGLSLGEYAALHCAGVFSFADGLRLVAERGKLMDAACKSSVGAMASVIGVDEKIVAEICAEGGVEIANLNCPGQIVISGESGKIAKTIEAFKAKGYKKIIPLKVAGAYHSSLMKEAGQSLIPFLEKTDFKNPSLPVAQNFTGSFVSDTCEIRKNLVSQVAGSVRWEQCFRAISGKGADTVIEIGPGNVLTGLAKRIVEGLTLVNVNSAGSLSAIQD